jgi:hypothetical protein
MKSASQLFLDHPEARWAKAYLWLAMTAIGVRDWLARWVFAQHNAKVIIDFEDRMVSVIYAASGGMMSKPYYSTEAMLQCIRENERKLYDYAYADGRDDLAAELGVKDPSPMVPE